MARLFILIMLIVNSSIAAAQTGSETASTVVRDATVAEISQEFAELNMNFQHQWQMAMTEDVAKAVVDVAIRRVMALRDRLADNPYIRIASFSVGLPAGISVEFTFPD